MSGHAFEEQVMLSGERQGLLVHRLKTRMSSFKGDTEPGDFIIVAPPYTYLIEAKSTSGTTLPQSMVRPTQFVGMLKYAEYPGVKAGLLIEMRKYGQVYYLDIADYRKALADDLPINIKYLKKYGKDLTPSKGSGIINLKYLRKGEQL